MVLISSHHESEKFTENLGITFESIGVEGVNQKAIENVISRISSECTSYDERPKPSRECDDKPPDAVFTCSRQKIWGKCSEAWMANYCSFSCHNCMPGGVGKTSSSVEAVPTSGSSSTSTSSTT
jgi:hypothetical protein